jgi:hypothetical protein
MVQLAVPAKVPLLRTTCGVGKHSYENFYLASVLNAFKKFCIRRLEMLIYLLKSFYLKLKLFGKGLILGEGFGGEVALLINYKPIDSTGRYCQ